MHKIEKLKKDYAEIKAECLNAERRVIEISRLEQDILHFIECGKYDAVAGAMVLKRLKEIRMLRRDVKHAAEESRIIVNRLDGIIPKLKYNPCVLENLGIRDILTRKI